MGGAYGLSLIEAGYKVNFLDVNRDHVNAVKENEYLLAKQLSKNEFVYFENLDERKFIDSLIELNN